MDESNGKVTICYEQKNPEPVNPRITIPIKIKPPNSEIWNVHRLADIVIQDFPGKTWVTVTRPKKAENEARGFGYLDAAIVGTLVDEQLELIEISGEVAVKNTSDRVWIPINDSSHGLNRRELAATRFFLNFNPLTAPIENIGSTVMDFFGVVKPKEEILPFNLVSKIEDNNKYDFSTFAYDYHMFKELGSENYISGGIKSFRAKVFYDRKGAPKPAFFIKLMFGQHCGVCGHFDVGIEVMSDRTYRVTKVVSNTGYEWSLF